MSSSEGKNSSRPSLGSFFGGKKPPSTGKEHEVSETSVTTETFPDLLAVFEKKPSSEPKPVVEKKPRSKKTTTAASQVKRKRLDPWEWHRKLTDQEVKRRSQVETQIQQNTIQYLAVKQLVADAMKETSTAYRWTKSITEIQDQFAQALVLKEAIDDVDMEQEVTNLQEQSNSQKSKGSNCEELPEKLKKEAENDDEETENSIAGSWVEGAVHEVAVVVTQPALATPPPKKSLRLLTGGGNTPSRCNDGSQPPVFAISFPNPKVSMEAYFILYKQHELLQQTFSRNGISSMSIEKIQQMKELCLENDAKLQELAGTIVQDWKDKEEAIHKLWGKSVLLKFFSLSSRSWCFYYAETYTTLADEVLSVVPKSTSASSWPKVTDADAANKSKTSLGDVWMAEILYRNAVKHQESELSEQGPTLQSLCEMVKDGERQRRLRLRKHLQVDVLQKHAAIFQRVQLAHAEALENYLKPNAIPDTDGLAYTEEFKFNENGFEDEYASNPFANDRTSLEKRKSKNTAKDVVIRKPSVQEQIQHIATFIGATAVWDGDITLNKYSDDGNLDVPTVMPIKIQEGQDEVVGVDVDFYLGLSSDDEDLPLLPDTGVEEKNSANMLGKKKLDRKNRKKSKKAKAVPDKSMDDEKYKVNNVVVLDQESVKHAYFMDRLLYTGSLLESHYVQFATVVRFDDHPLPYTVGQGETKEIDDDDNEKPIEPSKNALLVVTSDENLLLFEIPKSSAAIATDISNILANKVSSVDDEVTVMPGCPPWEALRSLLIHNVKADRIMKEQAATALASEKVSSPPPSPSKLSFLRSKISKEESIPKEQTKIFQFSNICPSVSMALAQCTVRKNLGNETSVRISHKSQNASTCTSSCRVTFASSGDQDAFLVASQNQNPMWDVN